ncbi:hypothetical protein MCO_00912 [Bartonella sp. DB5-6]|nr:hypothetical protein MCO_01583 [Bartonella sp. DB5-6]EJF77774.1 hypothetical protein MCO_00912 [Bartonella sp. DB5-6]
MLSEPLCSKWANMRENGGEIVTIDHDLSMIIIGMRMDYYSGDVY